MTSHFDPTTDPRVQEALSRKYSNDVVILLPLKWEPDTFAVFNNGRELCGFALVKNNTSGHGETSPYINIEALAATWHPPTAIEPKPTPKATLDDLELL
jgi:hypothetical protein